MKNLILLFFVGSILGCASLGEDIGRSLDPDFGRYLDNRTLDQEIEDERRAEEVRRSMGE